AWPNIGPDISTGNVGACASGSSYPFYSCRTGDGANACGTGFSCQSQVYTAEVLSNPAMDCYFSLGGIPSGGAESNATVLTNFDANVCYSATAPAASFSPSSLAFGNQAVGSTSANQQETLTNTGTGTLNLSSVALAGTNASDFTIVANACGP